MLICLAIGVVGENIGKGKTNIFEMAQIFFMSIFEIVLWVPIKKILQGEISHTGEGQRKPWIRIKNEDND